MGREKDGYRANLERINEAFPGKEMLYRSDIAKFEGHQIRTISKRYKFNRFGEISKADYARQISV